MAGDAKVCERFLLNFPEGLGKKTTGQVRVVTVPGAIVDQRHGATYTYETAEGRVSVRELEDLSGTVSVPEPNFFDVCIGIHRQV